MSGIPVVVAPAEVVVGNAGAVRDQLLHASGEHSVVVLDLTGTAYMDSAALGALVRVHEQLDARGGALLLSNLNGDLRALFELTRLDEKIFIRRAPNGPSLDVDGDVPAPPTLKLL